MPSGQPSTFGRSPMASLAPGEALIDHDRQRPEVRAAIERAVRVPRACSGLM